MFTKFKHWKYIEHYIRSINIYFPVEISRKYLEKYQDTLIQLISS